ncbi:MAG: dephospho-CoA kinase [Alphaproteobacteria bacterium]|nr:dephospho-CoA kinase [Alphaproteobacteria bacterium]
MKDRKIISAGMDDASTGAMNAARRGARPYVIGLTGSIASGKSAVGELLERRGYMVLDADVVSRRLSKTGGEAYQAIVDTFPEAVEVSKDGQPQLARKKLAELVFADPKKLTQLEQILHPLIGAVRQDFYRAAHQAGAELVFIMVPLLFEKNIDQECDATMVVVSNSAARKARALARPGMTESLLEKIQQQQMTDKEKMARADIVISNDGSLADLERHVDGAVAQMLARLVATKGG